MTRALLTGLASLALALVAAPAHADVDPRSEAPNPCDHFDGVGEICNGQADCAKHLHATACVAQTGETFGTCQVPCWDGDDTSTRAPLQCALGETCRTADLVGTTKAFACLRTSFRMDLNLLDMAVRHYLERTDPPFSDNECSLARNLDALLDQDKDGDYDIFDLDLAVLGFVERPACAAEPAAGGEGGCTEHPHLLWCDPDAADPDARCGIGLFCDAEQNACARECGTVVSREASLGSLDRECNGALKVCDRSRGRCEALGSKQLAELTCDVDGDCPNGAYCFLGQCAERCYSSTACPDSSWTCSETNRCRPLPPAGSSAGFEFDPAGYSIRFVRQKLKVSGVETTDSSSLTILDLVTRQEVKDNSAVVFGYRLETTYQTKQDSRCLSRTFVDCSDDSQRASTETQSECEAIQADCRIDPTTESWVRLPQPFGTVNGGGIGRVDIALDEAIAAGLSPGVYTARIRAIFDNGEQDTIDVEYRKGSPSGSYTGTLTVGRSSTDDELNPSRPLQFSMSIHVSDDHILWTDLMKANHIPVVQGTLTDLNSGRVVRGKLDGDSALSFARLGPGAAGTNEIPFVGIYQADKARIRIVGFIDIPADFCIDEDGADCSDDDDDDLDGKVVARNPFGRAIRRQIEFAGPFDDATGVFSGTYTESITGLLDSTVTMLGDFRLTQNLADASPLELDPIFAADATDEALQALAFTEDDVFVGDALPPECDDAAYTALVANFETAGDFACYLQRAQRLGVGEAAAATPLNEDLDCSTTSAKKVPVIFNRMAGFNSQWIEQALGVLAAGVSSGTAPGASTEAQDAGDAAAAAYLNIYDFLAPWLKLCDPSDPQPSPVCINSEAAACGLALYRKAIASGWVDLATVTGGSGFGDEDGDGDASGDEVDESNDPSAGQNVLFCSDLIPLDPTACPTSGAADGTKALFVLQEHNRFWSSLAQALKFGADRARSDAFLVLFRHQFNPFEAGTARAYKAERLADSIALYDRLVREMVGADGAWSLLRWPARSFLGAGQEWIDTMQTIVSDRMDVVAELIDLRRRVFSTADAKDFEMAQHLMQFEYLVQVFLMELQAGWQAELFSYSGEAGSVFERGAQVIQQLRRSRNSLGIVPERVFFESADPKVSNWQAYRDRIVGPDGGSGALGEAYDTVDEAIDQLQGALSDLDNLEASLKDVSHSTRDTLDAICGSVEALGLLAGDCDAAGKTVEQVNDCYCAKALGRSDIVDEWTKTWKCKAEGGTGCDSGFKTACGSGDCKNIVSTFTASVEALESCTESAQCPTYGTGTGAAKMVCVEGGCRTPCSDTKKCSSGTCSGGGCIPSGPTTTVPVQCAFDSDLATLTVAGKTRYCMGGEMRALLQEREQLAVQRRVILNGVDTLMSQIKIIADAKKDAKVEKDGLYSGQLLFDEAAFVLSTLSGILATSDKLVNTAAQSAECVVIGGLAIGTDCPQHVISGAIKTVSKIAGFSVSTALDIAAHAMGTAKSILEKTQGDKISGIENRAEFDLMVLSLGDLVDAYNVLAQEALNLDIQIQEKRLQAQVAAERWDDEVQDVARHLIGRESGFVLRSDHLVADASVAFRELVDTSYRMVVAFIHHYNVPPAEGELLINKALASTTLEDVEDLVALLDSRVEDYCGTAAIDCDAASNIETLRLSLRDLLFPSLRDIVIDAATGEEVTAAEQFHNAITAPPYVRRRVIGSYTVDQIELPVPVNLTMQEQGAGGPSWMIDPLDCNHLLTGNNPQSGANKGTMAVQVLGHRLDGPDDSFRYRMQRGPVDFIRGCGLASEQLDFGTDPVQSYPVRKHVIGYPPQNTSNDLESVPTFSTSSSSFEACREAADAPGAGHGADCWRLFGRDRSLASPDMKLVIPLSVNGAATSTAWITGEGLEEDERPIISDIVVNLRYTARPVETP